MESEQKTGQLETMGRRWRGDMGDKQKWTQQKWTAWEMNGTEMTKREWIERAGLTSGNDGTEQK